MTESVKVPLLDLTAQYEAIREEIGNFIEIYVACSIETLAKRDVKGLYKKAYIL